MQASPWLTPYRFTEMAFEVLLSMPHKHHSSNTYTHTFVGSSPQAMNDDDDDDDNLWYGLGRHQVGSSMT